MGAKKEIVEQKVEKITYTCDFCAKKIGGEDWPWRHECHICGRYACSAHGQYGDEPGDYPNFYCNECWKIGEDYRKTMKEIEDKMYEKIEECEKAWHSAAKSLARENNQKEKKI
jgi:hypothetical protein